MTREDDRQAVCRMFTGQLLPASRTGAFGGGHNVERAGCGSRGDDQRIAVEIVVNGERFGVTGCGRTVLSASRTLW